MRLSFLCSLLALLITGCSTTRRQYEMSLKFPNPLDQTRIIMDEKPRMASERFLTYTDEYGRLVQIPDAFVEKVVAPPVVDGMSTQGLLYDVHLKPENPYGFVFLRAPTKPTYETHQHYVFRETKDSEEQRISEGYVIGIAPYYGSKTGGRASTPEEQFSQGAGEGGRPNYRSTFEFR